MQKQRRIILFSKECTQCRKVPTNLEAIDMKKKKAARLYFSKKKTTSNAAWDWWARLVISSRVNRLMILVVRSMNKSKLTATLSTLTPIAKPL